MEHMDEASRLTWSCVFFTLGGTLAAGAIIRWVRWQTADGDSGAPQVLWTLGFLALGFLLVSAQLGVSTLLRQGRARQLADRLEAERHDLER